MVDKRKVIYSILKEIEKNEQEPRAEHYGINNKEFASIVDLMDEEGLIKGSGIATASSGEQPSPSQRYRVPPDFCRIE